MSVSAVPPLVAAGETPVNLAELLIRQAAVRPAAVALVQPFPERRTLTWAALDQRVDAVAAGLAGRGLIAGQRIGLCGSNTIEFVVAYFAALRAGYVVVPINPQLTAVERARIVSDSGLRLIFAETRTGDPDPAVETIALTAAGLTDLAADAAVGVDSPRDPEALAVLLYTAGTSGESKAAMLSHRALLAHLDQISGLGMITDRTVALAMLPLFHVFGLNAVLGSAAYAGATVVLVDGFTGFFDVLASESVTNLPVAPAVLARALHDPRCAEIATHVDTVISGAAPLSVEIATAFTARTGLRVDQGYGLTEAAPGVSVTIGMADEDPLGHGFVGRPLPGVGVRIGDGSDDGEPGEIWVRGANLFSGYWPDGTGGPDAAGWFATGDIGYLVEAGLFLVDRARELILVNGFNVFPAEVEEAIVELAGVSGAAVIGRPDPRTGEQVVAFVTGTVDVEAVRAHCVGRLAPFKRPAVVVLVDELPRGATGKVQKGALRRSLEGIDE